MLDFLTNHRKRRTQHAKPKPNHMYMVRAVFSACAIARGFSGIFAGVRDRELNEYFIIPLALSVILRIIGGAVNAKADWQLSHQ